MPLARELILGLEVMEGPPKKSFVDPSLNTQEWSMHTGIIESCGGLSDD